MADFSKVRSLVRQPFWCGWPEPLQSILTSQGDKRTLAIDHLENLVCSYQASRQLESWRLTRGQPGRARTGGKLRPLRRAGWRKAGRHRATVRCTDQRLALHAADNLPISIQRTRKATMGRPAGFFFFPFERTPDMADTDQPTLAEPKRTRLLSIGDVAKALGLSKPTIQRLVNARRFPPPLRLSTRCIRWRVEAVDEFLESLGTSSGAGNAPR
jgi:prophage regulatory protein